MTNFAQPPRPRRKRTDSSIKTSAAQADEHRNNTQRWATDAFEPTPPTWAAVIARLVYVILSPRTEWFNFIRPRARLTEWTYMLQREWEKETRENDGETVPPPPCEEEVFLRGVYEHARGVLDARSSTRPTRQGLEDLLVRRYSERTYENYGAMCLVLGMWVFSMWKFAQWNWKVSSEEFRNKGFYSWRGTAW